MSRDPNEPPADAFDRWIAEVENSPEARARRERDRLRAAYRRPNPYRDIPAIGLTIVMLGLLGYGLAWLVGWR